MASAYRVVFVSFPSFEEAKTVSRLAVEKRVAACVNIVQDVHSIYLWKGTVKEIKESFAIYKTPTVCVEDLMKLIQEHHKYSIPEILALPITEGHEAYLHWLIDTTKKQ